MSVVGIIVCKNYVCAASDSKIINNPDFDTFQKIYSCWPEYAIYGTGHANLVHAFFQYSKEVTKDKCPHYSDFIAIINHFRNDYLAEPAIADQYAYIGICGMLDNCGAADAFQISHQGDAHVFARAKTAGFECFTLSPDGPCSPFYNSILKSHIETTTGVVDQPLKHALQAFVSDASHIHPSVDDRLQYWIHDNTSHQTVTHLFGPAI